MKHKHNKARDSAERVAGFVSYCWIVYLRLIEVFTVESVLSLLARSSTLTE